jgi:hypothetical protein
MTYSIGSVLVGLAPKEAKAAGVRLTVLSDSEGDLLEHIAESMVPGARAAGIAHFVDQQLSRGPDKVLLSIRFFGIDPPYAAFYQNTLSAVSRAAHELYSAMYRDLNPDQSLRLLDLMRQSLLTDWSGPSSSVAYTAFRNDAMDVVYGTEEGMAKLGIPYMAHRRPPARW